MSTPVLCVVRGAAESVVVRAIDAAAELELARRCADVAELLAASAAGHGVVAVVSAGLAGVDLDAVRHRSPRGSGSSRSPTTAPGGRPSASPGSASTVSWTSRRRGSRSSPR